MLTSVDTNFGPKCKVQQVLARAQVFPWKGRIRLDERLAGGRARRAGAGDGVECEIKTK